MILGFFKGVLVVIACALVFGYVVKEQRAEHAKIDTKQGEFDRDWKQFDREFNEAIIKEKK